MTPIPGLDRYITGNYGEDYFRDAKCPDCRGRLRENEDPA
jgi:hypothetical protein